MLNSIVGRNRRISPLNETEKKIIRSATKLFLQNGFSNTTLKMISAECGMLQGTIAYHFHTKEDMLYMLIQELTDFHQSVVDETQKTMDDKILSYAVEITAQIAACENDEKARDLYHAAYTLPSTFVLIKEWTARKNYLLFKERLPHWSEEDYYIKENVACCVEYSAFVTPCDRHFTLDKKISLILDTLMMIYEVPEDKRKETIEKILKLDYNEIGKEMFGKFLNGLNYSAERLSKTDIE